MRAESRGGYQSGVDLIGRAVAALQGSDMRALERLRSTSLPARLTSSMRYMSRMGDGWLWIAAAALPLAEDGRGFHLLPLGAVAAAITNLGLVAAKHGVRRPRPPARLARVAAPDPFSFPSGHTANAFAACSVLSLAFPAAMPLLALLATGIASSRVLLGVHYPSDVVGGGALGVGAVALSIELLSL